MSTERSSAGDPATHSAPDPALMAEARARIMARWQAPAVVDTTPAVPRKPLKLKIATVTLAALTLVAGLLAIGRVGGDSGTSTTGLAQPTAQGRGYLPGVIDPLPDEESSAPAPSSAQPTTTTPGRTSTATNGVAKQPPAPVTFSAVAGPGCGGSTRFADVGSYRDGREGWVEHGDGRCGTSFVSIPMSGDAHRDDSSAFGLWTFATGAVTSGSCALSVFVPNGDITQVGGNPTSYRVYAGSDLASAQRTGAFEVKQVDQRGRWVGVGTFPVTGGKLAVQLLSRGVDWNRSGPTYAHHAAAQIKADCRA